jgi:hypothetical protein
VTYARWQEKCLGMANSMTFLWIAQRMDKNQCFQYATADYIIQSCNTAVAEHRAYLDHTLQKHGYEY